VDAEPSFASRAASDPTVSPMRVPASGRSSDGLTKVTLRLRPQVAARLAHGAGAAGSYGDYFASVLEGAPATPLPPDHAECLAALALSTDHLAVVVRDLGELARLYSKGSASAAVDGLGTLTLLETPVREHLGLASALLAALQAEAARRPRPSRPVNAVACT